MCPTISCRGGKGGLQQEKNVSRRWRRHRCCRRHVLWSRLQDVRNVLQMRCLHKQLARTWKRKRASEFDCETPGSCIGRLPLGKDEAGTSSTLLRMECIGDSACSEGALRGRSDSLKSFAWSTVSAYETWSCAAYFGSAAAFSRTAQESPPSPCLPCAAESCLGAEAAPCLLWSRHQQPLNRRRLEDRIGCSPMRT